MCYTTGLILLSYVQWQCLALNRADGPAEYSSHGSHVPILTFFCEKMHENLCFMSKTNS